MNPSRISTQVDKQIDQLVHNLTKMLPAASA